LVLAGDGGDCARFLSIRRQPAAHNVIGDMFAHVATRRVVSR